jgi:7-keto-8-aminopelargonate synthetase-like enzyme
MDGDVPPFKKLVALADQWGCLLYVDEAHAIGLFGADGRGAAEAAGVLDKIDIFVGTLSKALGTQGGFVATSRDIVDLLITRSRSFIYTTALAPACAAAGLAALELLPSLSDRRRTVLGVAEELRRGLSGQGYSCLSSVSQIVPVLTGSVDATAKLSKHLFDRGFFVPSIRPPTVPSGQGRLRLSVTYDTAKRGARDLLEAFAQGERIVKAR